MTDSAMHAAPKTGCVPICCRHVGKGCGKSGCRRCCPCLHGQASLSDSHDHTTHMFSQRCMPVS
ncbi:hypothetical protein [Prevotella nigrescens]|uniref:hypothetical protein n=1 Tax=Prevotella nigrescens TaxID=28133 RepID=UPI00211B25E3|nr:hypothetical protein [Prevotella nigrescens]